MAISRAQLVKELEPGLNALFGLEYDQYDREHEQIFSMEVLIVLLKKRSCCLALEPHRPI
jgi:hypothetical protein